MDNFIFSYVFLAQTTTLGSTTTAATTTATTAGLGTSENQRHSGSWPLSTEATVGIAGAVLVIAIVGLILCLWWKKRKGKWSRTPNLSLRFPAGSCSEPTCLRMNQVYLNKNADPCWA